MKTDKSGCLLVRSIEKCLKGVAESYAYNEVMYNYSADSDSEICGIIAEELKDEILPSRIYSILLNNSVMFSAFLGAEGPKANAEQIALMINSMLGLGIENVKVSLGNSEKYDEVKSLLCGYGYDKYIDSKRLIFDGFIGCDSKDNQLFQGFDVEIEGKNCIYSKIDFNVLIKLLEGNAPSESNLIPIALVAADDPSMSFSVALGLRSQGLKVEEYTGSGSMTDAFEYAELKNITILLWVNAETVMMTNLKTGERSETTVDKLLKK